MKKTELISVREFARRMNVSASAISKAIKRGRITATGEGRSKKIKWPEAQYYFNANRDMSKVRKKDIEKITGLINGSGINSEYVNDYPRWKAEKIKAEADILELAILEKKGVLIPVKPVEDWVFRIGRTLRNGLLNIPDRFSSLLFEEIKEAICKINETDLDNIEVLKTEIKKIFNKYQLPEIEKLCNDYDKEIEIFSRKNNSRQEKTKNVNGIRKSAAV